MEVDKVARAGAHLQLEFLLEAGFREQCDARELFHGQIFRDMGKDVVDRTADVGGKGKARGLGVIEQKVKKEGKQLYALHAMEGIRTAEFFEDMREQVGGFFRGEFDDARGEGV